MITSVSWMPKEASNAMGVYLEPCFSKEEIKETGDEIQLDEIAQAKVVAKSFGKPCSKSNVASSSSSSTDAGAAVNFMKELDMDNYDEVDDEIQLFSSCPGDLYYPSNDLDPYLKNNSNDKYDSEELEDITIRPTDSLIISTSIEGPISYLKVYICEESVNGCPPNIYLRDDLIIPEAPNAVWAMDLFGQRVLEPNVVWPEINLKKNHIRETVLEAFICQQFGKRHPPTYAPGRALSSNYPQNLNTQELENATLYQAALSTSRTIDVTYTYKAAAAVSWLAGSGATLMGIDVQYLLYKPTTLALAYGEHTLVYNLEHGEKLPRNVFINYLDGGCRVVGLGDSA